MENTAIVLLCFVMHYLYPCSNTQMVDKADIQPVLHTMDKQTGDLKWNLFTPKRTDSGISPTGIHKSKRAAQNRSSQSPGGLNVHMTSPSRRDNSYPGKGDYLTGFSDKGQVNIEGRAMVPLSIVPGNEHLARKAPSPNQPFVSHRYQGGRNAKPEFTIYNTVSGKSTIVTPLDRHGERRKKHLPAYDNWRTHFAAPGLFGNDRMYGTRYNEIRNKNNFIGYGTNSRSGIRHGNTVGGNVVTDKLLKPSETGSGPRTVDVFVAPGLYDEAPRNNKQRGPVKLGESTLRVGSFQRIKSTPNARQTVNRMERPRILNLVPNTNDHYKDSGNRIMNAANTQMEASGSGEVIVEGGIEIPSRFLDLASKSHSFRDKDTLIDRRANEIVKTSKPDIRLSQTLEPGEIVKLPVRGRFPNVSDKIGGLQNRVINNVTYNPIEHRRFKNTKVCK